MAGSTLQDVVAWHRREAEGYRRRAANARAFAESYDQKDGGAASADRHRRVAGAADLLADQHEGMARAVAVHLAQPGPETGA